MSEQLLQGFVNSIQCNNLQVHNIIILKHGKIISEKHWKDDIPKNQYSISKSFTSTAIGIAVEEGLLSLDDRLVKFFPKEVPDELKETYSAVTLRHLLTMSIGHASGLLMYDQRQELIEKNWIRFSLSQPVLSKPGKQFVYSNVNPYLAGVILQNVSGQTLVEFLKPRLFEPLDIQSPDWEKCPLGYTFGASGLMICTKDLAKFGQLYLQGGVWQGKRILSESWIREATSKQIDTYDDSEGEDWQQGYGYYFWRSTHNSFRADGMLGQLCLILPGEDAVIAINSKDDRMKQILDCAWSEILPIFNKG